VRARGDAGATVALGADDPLLFLSRLTDQYEALRAQGFTDAELAGLAAGSVRASFACEASKRTGARPAPGADWDPADDRPGAHARARALLELVEAPERPFTFDSGPGADLTALMSLLEGHAEFVMNEVPIARMPGKRHLIDAMKARREAGSPIAAFLQRAIGLDLKSAQYRDGVAFVREVVRQAGHEGLNAVWTNPLFAPSLEEIAAPSAWIRRVVGA